jgi:hypothetical protein
MNNVDTSRPPLWLRALRAAAIIGLAAALCLILALAVVAFLARHSPSSFIERFEPGNRLMVGVCIGILVALAIVLVPSALVSLGERKGCLSWKGIAVRWLAVGAVFVWLSWDDAAVRHPLSMEDFSPSFPGADSSYALLMRYSKYHPSPEAKAFEGAKWDVATAGPATIGDADKRFAFVAAKRSELEADWMRLSPQRRWLADLDSFERIGDVTQADPAADVVSFRVWMALSQRSSARAIGLAMDGKGDDAIDTLVPLIEVARKLQPYSRTLVRGMVGVHVEKVALEAAGSILDRVQVSAAARGRLLAALEPNDGPGLARHLVLSEYPNFVAVIRAARFGDVAIQGDGHVGLAQRALNFLGRLFINQNATVNAYGDRMLVLASAAEARDEDAIAADARVNDSYIPGMKNIIGELMIISSMPSYDHVIREYWHMVDEREALRGRLQKGT